LENSWSDVRAIDRAEKKVGESRDERKTKEMKLKEVEK
jgi:hypothetical protein